MIHKLVPIITFLFFGSPQVATDDAADVRAINSLQPPATGTTLTRGDFFERYALRR